MTGSMDRAADRLVVEPASELLSQIAAGWPPRSPRFWHARPPCCVRGFLSNDIS